MQKHPNISPYEITEEVWMVPCVKNSAENTFEPMCRPFSVDINWERVQCRQTWQLAEDEVLRTLVAENGVRGWSRIAKELNSTVHKGLPVRQGKQCRERYYNHIDPSLVKGQWTDFEDIHILKQQRLVGNKWSHIAKSLPGRTENQIKNRFKSLIKKAEGTYSLCEDSVLQYISERDTIHVPVPTKIRKQETPDKTAESSIGGMVSAFSTVTNR